jgi:hypothetical protein
MYSTAWPVVTLVPPDIGERGEDLPGKKTWLMREVRRSVVVAAVAARPFSRRKA